MRADIHDGQEARNAPRNGPNTDARDQLSPDRHIRLAPHGRSIQNEIGCARISMMARKQETLPAMGRIQMRETNYLQIVTSGLHRTAGGGGALPRRDGRRSFATMRTALSQWTSSSC